MSQQHDDYRDEQLIKYVRSTAVYREVLLKEAMVRYGLTMLPSEELKEAHRMIDQIMRESEAEE